VFTGRGSIWNRGLTEKAGILRPAVICVFADKVFEREEILNLFYRDFKFSLGFTITYSLFKAADCRVTIKETLGG